MKYIFFAGFLVLTTLFACNGDLPDNISTGSISYMLDDKPYFNRATMGIYPDDNSDSIQVVIEETHSNSSAIQLAFVLVKDNNNTDLKGIYLADDDESEILWGENIYSPDIQIHAVSNCSSIQGQIIITEHDQENRTISGTFEGVLCRSGNSKTITEGKLDKVRYTLLPNF
jgi:hypothetical protein